jgi:hypothetical protein
MGCMRGYECKARGFEAFGFVFEEWRSFSVDGMVEVDYAGWLWSGQNPLDVSRVAI